MYITFFYDGSRKIVFNFLGSHLLCYVWNVEDKCSFFVTWLFFHEKTCFWKAGLHFLCVLFVVPFLRHLQVLTQSFILRSYCFGSYHTELFLNLCRPFIPRQNLANHKGVWEQNNVELKFCVSMWAIYNALQKKFFSKKILMMLKYVML